MADCPTDDGAPTLADSLSTVDDALANPTDAELEQRYSDLKKLALKISKRIGEKIDIDSIADPAARRFINLPDWENYLKTGGSDPRGPYGAKTWDQWWDVSKQVKQAAQDKTPLTLDLLKQWNGDAIIGTVASYVKGGQLKSTQNYGSNTDSEDALTRDEITNLSANQLSNGKSVLQWTDLVCSNVASKKIPLPSSNPECKKIATSAHLESGFSPFWKMTADHMKQGLYQDQWYWYACWPRLSAAQAAKMHKRCGMIKYPTPATGLKIAEYPSMSSEQFSSLRVQCPFCASSRHLPSPHSPHLVRYGVSRVRESSRRSVLIHFLISITRQPC